MIEMIEFLMLQGEFIIGMIGMIEFLKNTMDKGLEMNRKD